MDDFSPEEINQVLIGLMEIAPVIADAVEFACDVEGIEDISAQDYMLETVRRGAIVLALHPNPGRCRCERCSIEYSLDTVYKLASEDGKDIDNYKTALGVFEAAVKYCDECPRISQVED